MHTSNEKKYPLEKACLKDRLRHAFAIGDEYEEKLAEDEDRLLRDLAVRIHARRLGAVAIPFLILNKPLNVVGASLLQMGEIVLSLEPIETFLKQFLGPNYTHELLVRTLEKRISIDTLVSYIEEQIDSKSQVSDKDF